MHGGDADIEQDTGTINAGCPLVLPAAAFLDPISCPTSSPAPPGMCHVPKINVELIRTIKTALIRHRSPFANISICAHSHSCAAWCSAHL